MQHSTLICFCARQGERKVPSTREASEESCGSSGPTPSWYYHREKTVQTDTRYEKDDAKGESQRTPGAKQMKINSTPWSIPGRPFRDCSRTDRSGCPLLLPYNPVGMAGHIQTDTISLLEGCLLFYLPVKQ